MVFYIVLNDNLKMIQCSLNENHSYSFTVDSLALKIRA